MPIFSDQTLMAFADEELDPAMRATVEAAMRDDPDVEQRVAQHRAMRARIRQTYAAELDDPVPERLLAAARGFGAKSTGSVSNLEDARRLSAARALAKPAAKRRWQPLASMAASLLIGVGIGYLALHRPHSIITANGGGLVASGSLAAELSNQLGSDRADSATAKIALSFLSRSGDICRVFTLSATSQTGLACRHANDWQIRMLAQPAAVGGTAESTANYRTAGSGLSPLILDAVRQQIVGEPLDGTAEAEARRRGWRGAGP